MDGSNALMQQLIYDEDLANAKSQEIAPNQE